MKGLPSRALEGYDCAVLPRETIAAMIRRGADAFPGLKVDRAAFARWLTSLEATNEANATDLYLAFSCATGDAAAWRELDRHLDVVPVAVARIDSAAAFGSEVRQRVAAKLLEGKLAQYTGRGPLGGWIRIVAVREAQTLMRERRRAPDDGTSHDVAGAALDPELALLKRQSAATFERAYVHVLGTIDAETRTTLRLYFVDRLTFEQLGRALACSRATAARRVADARKRLLDGVHDAIRGELGANAPGAETLFALVESQLQVSVLRHFGQTG